MPVAPRMAYYDDFKKRDCMFLSVPGAERFANTSALHAAPSYTNIWGNRDTKIQNLGGLCICQLAKQGCNPSLYANQTVSAER